MNTYLKLTFVIFALLSVTSSIQIREEVISNEELEKRVVKFNQWYHELNPETKHLEARLTEDGTIKLFTNQKINENDFYFTVNKQQMIRNIEVYNTKYETTLQELEETYGFDDIANFAIMLISEIHNPESKWKPYLDILPRTPLSLLNDYWNTKTWIEETLKNTSIPKKAFEKRLNIDKKARGMHEAYTQQHPDVFDKDIFSVSNIEWALLTVESRLIFVNYEGFLMPMLDLISYSPNKQNPSKFMTPVVDKDLTIKFKSINSFNQGDLLYDNPNLPNEKLLVSFGKVSPGSTADCLNLVLSFTQRKEDEMSKKRVDFFAKYFMFDQGHYDVM